MKRKSEDILGQENKKNKTILDELISHLDNYIVSNYDDFVKVDFLKAVRGDIYRLKGNLNAAFTELMDLWACTDNPIGYNKPNYILAPLGEVCRRLGDTDRAYKYLKKALKQNPHDRFALNSYFLLNNSRENSELVHQVENFLNQSCYILDTTDINLENKLTGMDAKYLACILQNNHNLTSINIGSNGFSHQAMEDLIVPLHKHPSLKKIDISSNKNIHHYETKLSDDDLTKYISKVLHNNTCLTELDLHGNNFSNLGLQYLGESLKDNTVLTSLDLHDIIDGQSNTDDSECVNCAGMELLFKQISTNSTLTNLRIDYLVTENDGNLELAWLKLLQNNTSLKSMYFWRVNNKNYSYLKDKNYINNIYPAIIQIISKNTSLTSLNIGSMFNENLAKNLIDALVTNKYLNKITLFPTNKSKTFVTTYFNRLVPANFALTHCTFRFDKELTPENHPVLARNYAIQSGQCSILLYKMYMQQITKARENLLHTTERANPENVPSLLFLAAAKVESECYIYANPMQAFSDTAKKLEEDPIKKEVYMECSKEAVKKAKPYC